METSPLICRANPWTVQSKSMDWFLHDWDLRHERVKAIKGDIKKTLGDINSHLSNALLVT